MTLVQVIANVIWAFLDIIILYTYFKYGKKAPIITFTGVLGREALSLYRTVKIFSSIAGKTFFLFM